MKQNSRSKTLAIFAFLGFLLYTIFFIYPMVSGAVYSFTNWKGLTRNFDFIGFRNYTRLFSDSRVMSAIKFSLIYTILLVTFTNIIALALSVLVSHPSLTPRRTTFFRSVYFFPAVLSLIVVGLIWNQLFFRALPLIGKALHINFLQSNLLAAKHSAVWGILIVNLWQGVAIPFVMLTAALQTVPKDLYESAYLDGIGPIRKFTKITFPFLIPTFNVTLVLSIKSGLTVFDYIKVLTNGGPAGATESIGMLIYDHGISSLRYGYSTAISMVLLVIICFFSFVLMKMFSRYEVGQV